MDTSTLVTITIREDAGKSFLTLIHERIGTEKQKADMTYGWTDAVDDMNKSYIDKLNGLSLTVKKKSVSVRRLIVTLRKGAFFLSTGAMPNTIKFDFKVSGKSKLKPHVPLKA